jgi:NTP pyrophosphatase (non-canonical NTP hydrolase)
MNNYTELAIRTEPTDSQYEEVIKRLQQPEVIRLLHAFMGICTESGEIVDALKKHIFYGKPLDLVNLKEEFGDLYWYLEGPGADSMANLLGTDPKTLIEDIKNINIEKLQSRYPEKFDENKAINRDLDKERKILEK